MTRTVRRAVLSFALIVWGTLNAPAARAQPAGLVLDGLRDADYQLLAQDPAGDLAADFATVPATQWADLTSLSVATDTTNLWVYIDLPNFNSHSVGQFGLAIDTDGQASSGGAQDPWGNGVTFAYTSTYNNVDTTPVITTQVLLPDVVIRGELFSVDAGGDGRTELRSWHGGNWTGATVNWGGVSASPIGAHVAFAPGYGVEFSIPFADLGVPPTTTLHLEFYATGPTIAAHAPMGAWDTLPADGQAPASYQATTQHRLGTFDPLTVVSSVSFSAASYAAREADGAAPITLTVAPSGPRLISVTLTTTSGTAGLADYVPISQTFTITPGLGSRVVPLHILTDTLAEPDETVFLTLSQPANARLAQPITATLTIHDSPPISAQAKLFLPVLRR